MRKVSMNQYSDLQDILSEKTKVQQYIWKGYLLCKKEDKIRKYTLCFFFWQRKYRKDKPETKEINFLEEQVRMGGTVVGWGGNRKTLLCVIYFWTIVIPYVLKR